MSKMMLAIVVLALSISALAQKETLAPRVEIFGGYSVLVSSDTFGSNTGANGWESALTMKVNRWFGIKADFSGHYVSQTITVPTDLGTISATAHAHQYDYLFGSQVSNHFHKFNVFAHGLIGGTRLGVEVDSITLPGLPSIPVPGQHVLGLGWVAGGGVDYELSSRVGLRLAQVDYHGSRLEGGRQNGFRYSAGMVFNFR